MKQAEIKEGNRFGAWTALAYHGRDDKHRELWNCKYGITTPTNIKSLSRLQAKRLRKCCYVGKRGGDKGERTFQLRGCGVRAGWRSLMRLTLQGGMR